ncbi:Cytochrome P450 2B12 [Hypsibius exemplaris]|uniref:Cytochrome P450 2B12 n=1 Tax=Hypsibius exemplaris TaxID=2072580 RepID=A0A1W0WA10_HYPEX|nr:Cytochrome P450 2B12 [Hypsibius exemplaris]
MGKTWLQDLIIEEARELVADLRNTLAKPVNPMQYLSPTIANVVCAISLGKCFSHKDENFRRLSTLISENSQTAAKNLLVEYFPFLRFVPFTRFSERYQAWMTNMADLSAFFKPLIQQHKQTLYEGEPRDYLHAYMLESEKQKDNPTTSFTSEQLLISIADLVGAGTDTTATTLAWAILYLIENPAVHERVQKEIDGVLGDGRYPTLNDRGSLPYTQATIFEVQRLANLIAVVQRRAMQEVTLSEYALPAGTDVVFLFSAVHEDPQFFPQPLAFKPERFLDESGKLRSRIEGFIPFSIGKRACLGEALAKMELYIFFVSLVKNFRFVVPPEEAVNSNDSLLFVVNSPVPYHVIFEPR